MKTYHNLRCNHLYYIILFTLSLLICRSTISYAATEDPGAGRLSGNNIPEEFYDNHQNVDSNHEISRYGLSRYGSFDTTNPYTGNIYSHHDTFENRTIVNGIDVSEWQGTIDWNKVKASGIDFAFIRVGYRGYGSAGTLNENTKDTYFDTNMKNAIAAGMRVGVYIFSQAITTDEAKEEALYILNHLNGYNVTMPLIMDYEYASGSSTGGRLKTANLSKEAATEICRTFCETISAAGYTPMIYANKSMLENQLNASAISALYPIWLANYTTNTTYGGTFDYWQYSSTGKVNGISGNVDMNFYYAKSWETTLPNVVNISSAVISPIPNQIYTGDDITPPITVVLGDKILVPEEDYSVIYTNNKNIGVATARITGKNHYVQTKDISFNIIGKPVSGLKAKKKSKDYITLSWNKDSIVNGYELYRSTSFNGTYKKIKTITSSSTTSFKNTGLNGGQCYYYKIRSYKTANSQKSYSEFTSPVALYTNLGYTRLALAKSDTTIYSGTDTTGNIAIANPAKNTTMTVTYATMDDNGNTWYNITYKSGTTSISGYVPSGKVTIAKQGKVCAPVTNVRKSYSVSSKKLTSLKKNKKITVLKTKKKKGTTWYKVTFKKSGKTYNGWIVSYNVEIV